MNVNGYDGDVDLLCQMSIQDAASKLQNLGIPTQNTRLGGLRLKRTGAKDIDIFSTRLRGTTPRTVIECFRFYNLHNNAGAISLDGREIFWSKFFWSDNSNHLARVPSCAFEWMPGANREGALLRIFEMCRRANLTLVETRAFALELKAAGQRNPTLTMDAIALFEQAGQTHNAAMIEKLHA